MAAIRVSNHKHDKRSKRICMVRNMAFPPMIPNQRNAEALIASGYEIDLVCLKRKGEKSREKIGGINVHRLPVEHIRKGYLRYIYEYSAFFILAFWKLTVLSLGRRYHAIEVSGMPAFMVFTAFIPRLLGTPVVFLLLDHTAEVFAEHFAARPDHFVIKFLRWTEKKAARWANYCIGTQIINKQILESYGVPASKIAVVLNVPDDSMFYRQPFAPDETGAFMLVTHGHMLERYGVQTLIKAVPLLVKDIPRLRVKIVGGGEFLPRLQELAESLGVAGYIEFTGWVPQSDVPKCIAGAHIGIVNIIADKNPMLPTKLFEYLALGKPAVTTATATIKAYFDNTSVMYFEPDNEHDLARCVLELYRDPEKRTLLAESGYATFLKYRWSTMKLEYLNVFDRLAAPKREMKTVCMLRNYSYPEINPTQRNAETMVAAGYEVDVVALKKKGQKSREVVNGVTVYRLPVEHHRKGILRYAFEYTVVFLLATWTLTRLQMKRKYRVIEVSGMPDFLLFAAFVPRLMGARIVLHLLDHTPGVYADHFKIGAGHPVVRCLKMIEKLCAHWADHIIVTQNASRKMLIKSGIRPSKITVILNVPDEGNFTAPPAAPRIKTVFKLLTHGVLVERYRVQTLIKAVPELLKEIPALKVEIVGDGEYQSKLEELARSLGVADRVDFTGRVPFKQIPAHIAAADVCVVAIPTGVNPAIPLKLLEYLAMGKPVVVNYFSTIQAYFDDTTMMFFRPDDEHDLARCVLELYRDPARRAALAAAGAAMYKKYKWSAMKHEYINVFERYFDSLETAAKVKNGV